MSEDRRPSSSAGDGPASSPTSREPNVNRPESNRPQDAFDQASPVARVQTEVDPSTQATRLAGTRFFERLQQRRAARIPYWDRPKPKRDLNWFLGKVGSSLIILGVLIFLFVGYQLWGTGIEAAQSQNRLEDKFGQIAQTTVPSDSAEPVPSPDPVVIDNGDPMAVLEMPTLGVTKYVVAGVETDDLKKGPGHYPSTPFPGQLGNAAIAGHRTTYGEPFRNLDDLQPGDPIIVTDLLGRRFVYSVTEQLIVQPEDSWVVNTVDPSVATLTLTTCHPEFSAKQRLIVFATLDTTQSDPVSSSAAIYSANVGQSSGLDALDENTVTTDPVDQPGVNITDDTSVNTADDTSVNTADDTSVNTADDVFNKGWFSDSDAYPQVALWILFEFLIIMGAWHIAKRYRNRGIGIAVGFIPAVVTLYFIFQNVNRLLPPNL